MQMLNRKLVEEVKLSKARYRKNELLGERRAKAKHNLVRWDQYRVRKAEMTELYTHMK